MIRISSTARLSFGLVILTMSILFVADMIGLVPSRSRPIIEARKRICESLAVFCTVAAQKNDIATIRSIVRGQVERNEDILSAAVRRVDGTFIAEAGDHGRYWEGNDKNFSTKTHIRAPIFANDSPWASIEVSFRPIGLEGFLGVWSSTLLRLVLFVMLVGFVVYRFFLKRTLRYLDPLSVIPPRVKAALDSLVEGIVIMDKKEQIVLANAAFEEKVERSVPSILGRKVSELDWTVPKSDKHAEDFPWSQALREGQSRTGVRLGLTIQSGSRRTFVVNSSPILDEAGRCRGAIATFDDVTQMEKQNKQLQILLKKLEASRDKIRLKNKKLKFFAARDPLTNCLNRRYFFKRCEIDISVAKRYGHELSCVMFDIDNFKSINDRFGHAAGDRVLREVVKVLRSLLRKGDAIGRYGGEEFCIILPHTGIDGAVQAAERYRRRIESHDFSGIRITASFGVSSLKFGAGSTSEFIDQTDQSLYVAKNSGRNCVKSFKNINFNLANKNSKANTVKDSTNDAKVHTPLPKSVGSKSPELPGTAPAVSGTDTVPETESPANSETKDALELVRDELNHSSKISGSMGLNVSLNKEGDTAIQLNKNGGWDDGGKLDSKNRIHAASISQAANVLKQPLEVETPHSSSFSNPKLLP